MSDTGPRTTSPGMTSAEWTALERTIGLEEILPELDDIDADRFRGLIAQMQDMIEALETRRLRKASRGGSDADDKRKH